MAQIAVGQFTGSYGRRRGNGTLRLFLGIVIIALLAGVAAGVAGQVAPAISHAILRHGADAALARQCLNGNQHFWLFLNPATKRVGTVCQVDGMWGVVIIDDKGNEITAFLKNKMTRVDQVIRYMRNAGYQLIGQ